MQKLFFLLIIILGGYIYFVIYMPDLAQSIAVNFGFEGLNEFLNNLLVKIPNQEALTNSYSGITEIKDKIVNGIDFTKDKIDSVRIYISGSQDYINDIKDLSDEVTNFIENSSGKIDDVKNIVNEIKSFTSTGTAE